MAWVDELAHLGLNLDSNDGWAVTPVPVHKNKDLASLLIAEQMLEAVPVGHGPEVCDFCYKKRVKNEA